MRVCAYTVDSILITAATFVVSLLFDLPSVVELMRSQAEAAIVPGIYSLAILTLVIGGLYYAALESSKRLATVGKLLFGLVVTDIGGDRLGIVRALSRSIIKTLIIVVFPIAMILIVFNARKRGLHDFVASTQVFKSSGNSNPQDQ